MARPTAIRPGTPTEEILLDDGSLVRGAARPAPAAVPDSTAPAAGDSTRIGGGRRAIVVGLALGALVLAVAGAGWAGRSTPAAPGGQTAADPLPQPTSVPLADAPTGADDATSSGSERQAFAALVGFPAEVDGLLVVSVEGALQEAGQGEARPLAIAGWLTIESAVRSACVIDDSSGGPASSGAADAPAPLGRGWPGALWVDPRSRAADFCRRAGVIRDAPGASWQEPHLHPQFLPGLSLAALPRDRRDGVPVVLIGHYRESRALGCLPDGRSCGHELIVDRVAWAEGRPMPTSLSLSLPGPLDRPTRPPARAGSIVEFYGTIPVRTVSVAGVAGSDLHRLDPDAASAVAATGAPPAIAWYVRFIVPDAVNGRVNWTVGWAVVDDATGSVIARRFG